MKKALTPTFLHKQIRFLQRWLQDRLNGSQLLLVFSIFVGLSAGVAAAVLKTLVHYIRETLVTHHSIGFQNQIFLVFPLIGILITVLIIRVFFHKKWERGVASILVSISRKSSRISKVHMFSQVITSGITVGFGGSAGLESPIVMTGSAIGSNYGKASFFTYKERTVLLACGASAGIAAVFNAPIAGLLFALEVLLADVTISAFIPLISASVAGVLCSKVLMREEILFSFRSLQPFNYHLSFFYVLLGLLCGVVSVYYAQTTLKIEKLFHKMGSEHWLLKALIGGLVLGILIFIFPPLFGEGYSSIIDLSHGNVGALFQPELYERFQEHEWLVLFFIGAVGMVKVVATSVTLASGGNGGNFAPSLFVGGYVGFCFSRFVNMISSYRLPEDNFTVVGMAGILAGVMYAPLTGVFLIAEITHGYDLIIPLMVVAAASYAFVRRYELFSMDTRELARKGHILTQNRDMNILRSLSLEQLVETNFLMLTPETTLREIVEVIPQSKRNLFPVVSEENQELLGIILLDDLKEVMFNTAVYDTLTAAELMKAPPLKVSLQEDMPSVMRKFDSSGVWNLPVIHEGKYQGFISKSSIFTEYRKFLVMQSEK